jgi:hypothetical protein
MEKVIGSKTKDWKKKLIVSRINKLFRISKIHTNYTFVANESDLTRDFKDKTPLYILDRDEFCETKLGGECEFPSD